MAQYISSISQTVQAEVVNFQNNNQDAYRSYLLVTVANGAFTQQFFYDFPSFNTALSSLSSSTIVGNCTESLFGPLQAAFNELIYNKSPFYIFTDAPVTDLDQWRGVIEGNAVRKLPLFVFFVSTPQFQNCSIDTLDPGYRTFSDVAAYTGGLFFTPSADVNKFKTLFSYAIRATTYKVNQVLMDDLLKCSFYNERAVFTDSSTQTIFILATGTNMQVSLVDPRGANAPVSLVFQDGTNYIYELDSIYRQGQYGLTISGAANLPCSYRVLEQGDYDLFVAVTTSLNLEAIDSEPIVGFPTHIVAQLTGLQNAVADPFRLFAELTITTNAPDGSSVHDPLFYANGLYRSGCGYHLYFGSSAFCREPDLRFYATVYADDAQGYTIQRTVPGYCTAFETTVAPPGTCQNGGVPAVNNRSSPCLCSDDFSGPYCAQIICQNGGTAQGSFCICPPGTGGSFCQLYACSALNPNVDLSQENRALAFIISTASTMQPDVQAIASAVAEFVRDAQASSPSWITSWILATVSNSGGGIVMDSRNATAFIAAVQTLAANASAFQPPSADCSLNLWAVAYQVQQLISLRGHTGSYINVFADSDAQTDSVNRLLLLSQLENQRTSFSLIGTKESICNPQNTGTWLDSSRYLSIFSNGFAYQVATSIVPRVVTFLATFHNGVDVGLYTQPSCTASTPLVLPIPIDGFTQAFSVTLEGQNISYTIKKPDGTPAVDLEVPILSDQSVVVNQYLALCDGGQWQVRNIYCYRFAFLPDTWANQRTICHQDKGSFVVDIHSQDKQTWADSQTQGANFWLGLYRNTTDNQFYWDTPDGVPPIPLNTNLPNGSAAYSNWANGEPSNDPSKNCVYANDQTSQWYTVSCNASYPTMCQKHRYGQGYYNNDPVTNLVNPGIWTLTVQAQQGLCAVRVVAQTLIQVVFGFTTDAHDDSPSRYAIIDSTSNLIVAAASNLYPVGTDRNPQPEGRLNYALLGINSSQLTALNLADRQLCSYSYVSTTAFDCNKIDNGADANFIVKFSGIDQFGFAFDRFYGSFCQKKVTTCQNGGVLAGGRATPNTRSTKEEIEDGNYQL